MSKPYLTINLLICTKYSLLNNQRYNTSYRIFINRQDLTNSFY